MSEKVSVRFYRVKKCGYYGYGKNDPAFGSFGAALSHLQTWATTRELRQTKLFEAAEGDDVLPAYLSSIDHSADAWLLCLWNETPTYKSGAASVAANAKVGKAQSEISGQDPGRIFGFATYFWLLPDLGVYAALRINQESLGQRGMQKYLEMFLHEDPDHVVLAPNPTAGEPPIRVGYAPHKGGEPKPLYPHFVASPAINPGERDFLIANVANIRKVTRKTELNVKNAVERMYWQQLVAKWSGLQKLNMHETVRLRYDLEQRLMKEDLVDILDKWDASPMSKTEDIGFTLVGDPAIKWLSHSLAKADVDLNFQWQDDTQTFVNPISMLAALNASKKYLLTFLK